ncbi:MAG: acetyl-CoA carboxylase carboxyl transferase subunit alpha [Bacilli bacterium]|nr:acetyl-CoA carboxylase carboxyl transferase subunit alpha [Bacilli bacterium]
MSTDLQFERPLLELRAKIDELKKFTEEKGIDFSEEVEKLEDKAQELEKTIYGELKPMQRVQMSKHAGRPTTLDYIRGLTTEFIELHGDRNFRDDPALVGGIGRIAGLPVTILGHQKGRNTKENVFRNWGSAYPEGYRKAMRLMKQAEKFGRPVVCLIDTAGAYPGAAAEERGQAEAIATNLITMAGLRVPIVCVVTGEGGSGGALGLGIGDRVYMLENAYYSVISPEGAAAILLRDASQAARAADLLKLTSNDLLEFGIIDDIIKEPLGGAHRDPDNVIAGVKQVVSNTVVELSKIPVDTLLQMRYDKYRSMGHFTETTIE